MKKKTEDEMKRNQKILWRGEEDGEKNLTEAEDQVAARYETVARTTSGFFGWKYSKLFHIISKIDSDNDISPMTRLNVPSSL